MVFRPPIFDMVVVGGSAAGLSIARRASLGGLQRIVLLEARADVAVPDVVDDHDLVVHHETTVRSISLLADECVVHTDELTYRAKVCVLATSDASLHPTDHSTSRWPRIHRTVGDWLEPGMDVAIVGDGHRVVQMTEQIVEEGAFVTVCLPATDRSRLSEVSLDALQSLEHARRVVLVRGADPVGIEDRIDGVEVRFADGSMPTQLFDGLVYPVRTPDVATFGLDIDVTADEDVETVERLYSVADSADVVAAVPVQAVVATTAEVWDRIARTHFSDVVVSPPSTIRPGDVDPATAAAWRRRSYNATVDYVERVGETLVVRVRPDVADDRRRLGTVATVGVGAWEPVSCGTDIAIPSGGIGRLLRIARPVGTRVLDDDGYLVDPRASDEMVFRFPLDEPDGAVRDVAARLDGMTAGGRMFVGPTVRVGCSAAAVKDPILDVLLIAGDGAAAAQDAALVDLVRRGHRGKLIAVVLGPRSDDLVDPDAESLAVRYGNVVRTVVEAERREWAAAAVETIEHLVLDGAVVGGLAIMFTMGLSDDVVDRLERRTSKLGIATIPGGSDVVQVDLTDVAALLSGL